MSDAETRELALLDSASRLLAEAESLQDVKTIRDKAEATRVFARAAQMGLNLQNRAAELKLRAERKAGTLLASLRLRGGDRRSKRRSVSLKLQDLGITRHQSKRWQQLASVSEPDFSEYLRVANAAGREVTSAAVHRIARSARRRRSPVVSDTDLSKRSIDGLVRAGAKNDFIGELMNHCQLLSQILRPIYESKEHELKLAEKRVVGRLLTEMSQLLQDLNDKWPAPHDVATGDQ